MAKLLIFGIGEIAEIAYFYIKNDSDHEIIGFTVDKEYLSIETFHGLPVIAYEDLPSIYPPNKYKLFMPISYRNVNQIRADKFYDAKSKGYNFISYISSKASYYNTKVGENCFILENNVIQPCVEIGDNCILWSGNHVGHHTIIRDHCFVSSHVVISGSVKIGEYTFLGVNSTVRDNVIVGIKNVIGAGSLILENTDEKAVFPPKGTEKSRVPSNRLRGV